MDTYLCNRDYTCNSTPETLDYFHLVTETYGSFYSPLELKKGELIKVFHGSYNFPDINKIPLHFVGGPGSTLVFIEHGSFVYIVDNTQMDWLAAMVINGALIKTDSPETLSTEALTPRKVDPEYPHQCPYCRGPAWLGGFNNVDCKGKCLEKN